MANIGPYFRSRHLRGGGGLINMHYVAVHGCYSGTNRGRVLILGIDVHDYPN